MDSQVVERACLAAQARGSLWAQLILSTFLTQKRSNAGSSRYLSIYSRDERGCGTLGMPDMALRVVESNDRPRIPSCPPPSSFKFLRQYVEAANSI